MRNRSAFTHEAFALGWGDAGRISDAQRTPLPPSHTSKPIHNAADLREISEDRERVLAWARTSKEQHVQADDIATRAPLPSSHPHCLSSFSPCRPRPRPSGLSPPSLRSSDSAAPIHMDGIPLGRDDTRAAIRCIYAPVVWCAVDQVRRATRRGSNADTDAEVRLRPRRRPQQYEEPDAHGTQRLPTSSVLFPVAPTTHTLARDARGRDRIRRRRATKKGRGAENTLRPDPARTRVHIVDLCNSAWR
ncbi:hypothetical protein B0H11DRAFT_2110362 [Mycena galericulata]|nr:hypothetical protein B0H11DRAFT_2110362 [Mycena galericulata]